MPTPHVLIHCEDCQLPILLHAGVLQQPFADPEESPNDTFAIGVACPYCKHLRRYFLHQIPARNPLGAAFVADTPDEDTVQVFDGLRCAEPTCEFLLPIFARWNVSTTAGERKADISIWKSENLLCPEGHAVVFPRV